jgi:hypothetical protein
MTSLVNFNPMLTTTALGSFNVSSDGYTQGTAYDDPASRNYLSGGILASTETLPMWGGVAIQELISPSTSNGHLGNTIARATANTNVLGFSVFNQGHNAISFPGNNVPVQTSGMTVPFYRLGSNARIAVACDPSLVSLDGGLTTQQVSWDFNNQVLQPYDAATATVSLTSITSSYSGGVYTFVVVAAAASLVGAVGDSINVSGVTGTGAALVNGNQVVTAFTDNQHFSFQVTAASGAIATGALTGTLILNQGTGAISVRVLNIAVGNSRNVIWDGVNLTANFNSTGTCALILI